MGKEAVIQPTTGHIPKTAGLLQDPDPGIRRSVAETFAESPVYGPGREIVVDALVRALEDPDVSVQEAALDALVVQGGRDIAARLFPLLRGDATIRSLALEGLQELGSDSVAVLIQAKDDPDPHIRKFVADLLGPTRHPDGLPALRKLLGDPCVNVRVAAATSLGLIPCQESVEGLIQACADEEPWVRFSAIHALGELGSSRGLPTLRALLDQEDSIVICGVVEALGKIGTVDDVPRLLAMLPTAGLPLRHYLFVTIVQLVGSQAEVFSHEGMKDFVFKELVSALQARQPEVRVAAVRGLRVLNDERATVALLEALRGSATSRNSGLQEEIAVALQAVGEAPLLIHTAKEENEWVSLPCIRALGVRRCRSAVEDLCEIARSADSRERRRAALESLRAIGAMTGMVEDTAIAALEDPIGFVRAAAAGLVEGSRLRTAESVLCRRLSEEPFPDVIEAMVRALLALDAVPDHRWLRALLAHERVEVRRAAAAWCPNPALAVVHTSLLACLTDEDWGVRVAVVERLKECPMPSLLPYLKSSLLDAHPYVRQAAVPAIGAIGTPEALACLRDFGLQDPDLWVRVRSLDQIADHRDSQAGSAVVRLLNDAMEPVQFAAVRAVGQLRESSAVPALRELCHHPDGELAELAAATIHRLGECPGQEVAE